MLVRSAPRIAKESYPHSRYQEPKPRSHIRESNQSIVQGIIGTRIPPLIVRNYSSEDGRIHIKVPVHFPHHLLPEKDIQPRRRLKHKMPTSLNQSYSNPSTNQYPSNSKEENIIISTTRNPYSHGILKFSTPFSSRVQIHHRPI